MSEMCKSGLLKARLSQSLSDTRSGKKRTVRDVLFQLLGYQPLVTKFSVTIDIDLREKEKEIAKAHEKLLEK